MQRAGMSGHSAVEKLGPLLHDGIFGMMIVSSILHFLRIHQIVAPGAPSLSVNLWQNERIKGLILIFVISSL